MSVMQTADKMSQLKDCLRDMERVIVAFSAGVDSTFLLKVAADTLGSGNALACTAVSPSLAESELASVRELARQIGTPLRLIETTEMDNPLYAENSPKRCYYCKAELYERLKAIAEETGIRHIVNGANVDDKGDYRPGMDAATEWGVRSPLMEAGLSKADIRQLSKELGLPTWDKPALACLASRVPYGTPVTIQSLSQIEKGEAFLRQHGFKVVRVRHHNTIARIEVPVDSLPRLLAEPFRSEVVSYFKALGYTYVSQLCRSGASPVSTAKNARCNASVTGPRLPEPIVILSTDRIGVTSTAVPAKNSSSATYSVSRGIVSSRTSYPSSRASVITESRVMPGRMEADAGGVRRMPSRTTKMFSPLPSLTNP